MSSKLESVHMYNWKNLMSSTTSNRTYLQVSIYLLNLIVHVEGSVMGQILVGTRNSWKKSD